MCVIGGLAAVHSPKTDYAPQQAQITQIEVMISDNPG
jgi:hypothetical protein